MTGLLSYKENRGNKKRPCLLACFLDCTLMSSQLAKDSACCQVFNTEFLFSVVSLFCELR